MSGKQAGSRFKGKGALFKLGRQTESPKPDPKVRSISQTGISKAMARNEVEEQTKFKNKRHCYNKQCLEAAETAGTLGL